MAQSSTSCEPIVRLSGQERIGIKFETVRCVMDKRSEMSAEELSSDCYAELLEGRYDSVDRSVVNA